MLLLTMMLEISIVNVNNDVTVKGTVPKASSIVKYKLDEQKSCQFCHHDANGPRTDPTD